MSICGGWASRSAWRLLRALRRVDTISSLLLRLIRNPSTNIARIGFDGRDAGMRATLTMCGPGGRAMARHVSVAFLVSGCTIFTPIQLPDHDRRFALKDDPVERVQCVDPDSGQNGLCSLELKDSLDDYYGELARAMWETDLRRRKLVAMGLEKAQLTNAYNALLWPLGAFFITRKIRHPEWSTLDTAAVAAASYGLLGSGIPERDKLYLRTASRMACAMVVFEPQLYRRQEVEAPEGLERAESPSLMGRIERLAQLVLEFENVRDALVATLKARPAKQAPPGNPSSIAAVRANARRDSARGGEPAGVMKDFIDPFFVETNRQLETAQLQIKEARELAVALRTSGTRLRQQRGALDFALNEALVAGTPPLVSPEARAKEIVTVLESHLAATKAGTERLNTLIKQSGTSRTALWTVTDASLQALDEDSRRRVLHFWTIDRPRLQLAQTRLSDWMTAHRAGVQAATETAKSMGCSESTLEDFSQQLLKLMAAAAQPPASGASR